MSKCFKCQKELTTEDFLNEEEIYLCSPRSFLGEGYSNWSWGDEKGESHSGEVRCIKHRLPNMVKTFADLKTAKAWVQDMLTSME